MTTEQQRKILEAAAKACGLTYLMTGEVCDLEQGNYHWNPLANALDTADMCAELEIDTLWTDDCVICGDNSRTYEAEVPLDNSRLKAWMFAATMAAAKIGGYNEP